MMLPILPGCWEVLEGAERGTNPAEPAVQTEGVDGRGGSTQHAAKGT